MASRGIKAAPRGKPSGLPFHARFTDVAAQAGLQNVGDLRAPRTRRLRPRSDELRGGVLRLRQRRLDGHSGALRIAIRRPARGRLQPSLQEQPRRHLHRRHPQGRPVPNRLHVRRNGRRLQQRRLRGPVPHRLGPERAVPQQRRRHVYRRHEGSRPARPAGALRLRMRVRGLRPRRPARPVRLQLPHLRHQLRAARRPVEELQCRGRVLRTARTALRAPLALSQQRRRHVLPMSRTLPASASRRAATASPWWPRTSTTTAGPISTLPATPPRA